MNKNIDVKQIPDGDSKDFFPTPKALAQKMLSEIEWEKLATILEPEAGKGDLADAIKEIRNEYAQKHFRYNLDNKIEIDCIERDTYLQHILRGKGYRVIHDNFLTYIGKKTYDLIIMNPPFSSGAEHLLKALEIQQYGGGVVCLLNADTLRNPFTNQRKLLCQKLQELNAKIEFLQEQFTTAERKTNVEIAFVKVFIPAMKQESRIFSDLYKADPVFEKGIPDLAELAPADAIEMMVRQYNIEVNASLKLIHEYWSMQPYILRSFDKESYEQYPILKLSIASSFNSSEDLTVNEYLKKVRAKYWETLLMRKDFTGKLTSTLQRKYLDMVRELSNYDFSLFNIERVHADVNAEIVQGIADNIMGLFDKLSANHAWYPECANNIHYYNGWSTNKAHKVGMKVILPINGAFCDYSWVDTPLNAHRVYEQLIDIEKTLNYLSGKATEETWLDRAIENANRNKQTRNIECKYFNITLYKKGTVHIKFKDAKLIDMLNIFAARKKNWLPPSYGKTKYDDMPLDEQKVIDEFQGKDAYEEVLRNKNTMLYSVPEQLLLSA